MTVMNANIQTGMIMNNTELESLKIARQAIDEKITLLELQQEQIIKKWEPKGGPFWINSYCHVQETKTDVKTRESGTERGTKEQAEKAAIEMRKFKRLLAYRDEFAPGYEFKQGDYNYFIGYNEKEYTIEWSLNYLISVVYMTEQVAKELCKKLNSGDVEL